MSSGIRRREFLQMAAGAAAVAAAPTILTAKKTEGPVILGSGEHRYEVIHDWPKLPDQYTWQTTHNVAMDKAGNVYVIHEGHADKPDHPAIFVFDPEGKFIRAFGKQFQGGGHGLEIRAEGNEEFLYVTAYLALKFFAKLTLDGETVWERRAPMETGLYAAGEDTKPENVWGRDRFHPTNIAFHPENDDFFLIDGYGAYVVHRYDKDGSYKSTFGKTGKGDGEFDLPHGIWIDKRTVAGNSDAGNKPRIVVADRVNARLQWFTLDGEHLQTLDGFLLPANVDTYGEIMLVPDLRSRVTLLDGSNKIIAHLGDEAQWREDVMGKGVRNHPDQWPAGRFIHPHDACFDKDGNIFVAEWVATGRVSKLRKLS